MSSTADQMRDLAEACQLMALSTNNSRWLGLAERSTRFADRLDWGDFPEDRPVEDTAAKVAPPPPPQISPPLKRAA